MGRANENPNPDCVVCQDDSGYIATVTVKSLSETTMKDLVESILPNCLSVKRDSDLIVDFEGKILFEKCEDMSDDESAVYNRRMLKSLTELGLKPFSILMIQADIA